MFAGTILDTWTTWVFVSRHYGFEMNPILAPLIRHSLIWIPIYLLCRPLLVPFLPEICRLAFAVYFGLGGLLFGSNNLSGILYGRYFLMDVVSFPVAQGTCVLVAITAFIWMLWRRVGNAQERKQHIITALRWIGIFMLLELGFFAAGRLAFR
jgi:hypothetical protein